MAFQQKCLSRMRQFKREGVAIVFVSHNMQAVSELCDRAILLQSKVLYEGDPAEAIRRYLGNGEAQTVAKEQEGYRLKRVSVGADSGLPLDHGIPPGTRISIRLTVEADRPADDLLLGIVCRRSTDGLIVYDGNFTLSDHQIVFDGPGNPTTLAVSLAVHLTRGLYSIELFLMEGSLERRVLAIPTVAVIRVDEQHTWQGVADLDVSVFAG
jgi:lipopolysaccharide transport system ATP-binding protein